MAASSGAVQGRDFSPTSPLARQFPHHRRPVSPPPPSSPSSSSSPPPPTSPPSPWTVNGVRSPNAAKRVPRNPADELRSAVNRDVLREEARKAAFDRPFPVQRNVSAPILAASPPLSPPTSPDMTSQSNQLPSRPAPASNPSRNFSMDSTLSSTSNNSPKPNGASAHRPQPARPETIACLIAAAGSPEAALQKLFAEKEHAASHNAQLWRLVEKQRTMIMGLNKDLEKALKEKERYRKRLKDQLQQSESAPTLTTANMQLEQVLNREESESPAPLEHSSPTAPINTRDISIDSRKVSETSEGTSFGPGRSDDTPLDASNAPSSVLPATPLSAESPHQIVRDLDLAAATAVSAQENRAFAQSPTKLMNSPRSPQHRDNLHKMNTSISSTSSNPTPYFSSPKIAAARKGPPAPLKLSSQREAEAAAKVTNNIIDPSDSEYEEDPDSARAEQAGRGRRKTREDDDREREAVARQEMESRSQSTKDGKGKTLQSTDPYSGAENVLAPLAFKPPTADVSSSQARTDALMQRMNEPPAIVSQQARAIDHTPLPKSSTAPSLLSPGLPMSPRPVDRPVNSPMPRAPNKVLNSIPTSPNAGMVGLPLSPRAPRQPFPVPRQDSLPGHSAYQARPEGYQAIQPQSSTLDRDVRPTAAETLPPEQPYAPTPAVPMTPGEIYQGLVTDEYPDLLLPPNALPSIYVKTASSRMRPSRQSYLAPKAADDNPVFTLAVFERSDKKQLWRVEKTFAALALLDEEVKTTCNFRERMPDKVLFNGHAPARIDARRAAIDMYLNRMLESVTDDRSAMVVCRFLSTDAFGTDGGSYFGGSVDLRSDTPLNKKPRREGYLTKRGKNFGGWKARFFVLDGPIFKYYDSQGGAQLGSIKLQNAQIGKQSTASAQTSQEDEDNQFRHAFLILEPKKKDSTSLVRHVLCAESDEERDVWVDALLQYVDHKDDSEEPSRAFLSAKAAEIGPPRSPRLQKSLNDLRPSSSREGPGTRNDELRAVGYSDVVAGDAPVMGPPSPRIGTGAFPPLDGNFGPAVTPGDQATSSHPNISGPSNPQVISNAGEWGMKPAPTPQSKDKKRGIFSGFRGRSSSDLGPNDKPPAPTSYAYEQVHSGGPPRAVFGAPLEDASRYSRPADISTDLPAVVYRCIEYLLSHNAVAEEGIFRLSGSNTVIKALRDRFNTEGDVNLSADGNYYDIHAVASLLKLYLRELPSSILTRELHLEFLTCQEKQGREKLVGLNALVNRLPTPNRALLAALSSMLQAIVNNAEVNKMNIRNVGIVFSPTLNVPAPLISSFVEDQGLVFGPPLTETNTTASYPQQPKYTSNPYAPQPQTTTTSTDLRSPRKQMFSDLPTPAYGQTTFQSLGVLHHDHPSDPAMIPVHPGTTPEGNGGAGGSSYAAYVVAPRGEAGFGSLNDALKTPAPPTVYGVASNGVMSARDGRGR